MNRNSVLVCFAAALLCLAAMPAAAGCLKGTLVSAQDNRTTVGVIRVRAGSSCAITHGASLGPMFDTVIAKSPEHGVARVEGRHRVVYTPARSYVGRDRFVYVRRGLDMSNNKVARVVGVRVVVFPARSPNMARRN